MRKLLFFFTQDCHRTRGWIPQGSPGPFRDRASLVPAAGRPHRSPAPRRGCGRRGSRGGCCLESAGKHGMLLGQSMGKSGNIWKTLEKRWQTWGKLKKYDTYWETYGSIWKNVGNIWPWLKTRKNISFKITIPLEPLHFRHWFQLVLFACRMIWDSHTCQNYITSILQAIHMILFVYILTQKHAHHKSHFLLLDGFVIVCLNMRYTTPPPPKEQLNGKIDDQPMDRIW